MKPKRRRRKTLRIARRIRSMAYPSKKDAWIVFCVLFPGAFLFLFPACYYIVTATLHPESSMLIIYGLFYVSVLLFVGYPTKYEITTEDLIIYAGLLLRFRIPLMTIQAVRPSRNPLSAPAWSLDRLRIEYSRKGKRIFILISPKDQTSFLGHLAASAPHLVRVGGDVIEASSDY